MVNTVTYSNEDDLLLIEALNVYHKKALSDLPNNEELEKITFTENFEKKMQKLIKAQKKPHYNMTNSVGKRFACILVAIIALFTMVMSVSAIREPFIKFIVETFDKYSAIYFAEKPTQATHSFERIIPEYIPAGFEITIDNNYDIYSFIEYKNETGNIFTLQQRYCDENHMLIDTENTQLQKILINNEEAIYYEKSDTKYLVFTRGEYGFILIGNLEKEEIIKIAKSV